MCQNAPSQSNCRIFKLIIHFEQNDKKPDFLHVDADSWKLKIKKHWGGLCQKWVWPL